MIQKTLKTTHGKLNISIPTQLSEVTLGQLMEMQEKTDMNDLDAISILSSIPVAELKRVVNFNDFQPFGDHVLSLSHQIKELYQNDTIPKKVRFILDTKQVEVNVIRNLSVEPAGAFMAARDIISEEINEHIKMNGEEDWKETFNPSLKACCHILAHYFYCRVTGNKYDEYAAEQFCGQIKKLGVTEALPIAKRFFTIYPGLSKQRTGCFHRFQQLWKKRLVSISLKSLSISIP